MQDELFDICCERDPDPSDQRKRLLQLIKAGVDVHATDKNGVTALHHAVRFRSPAAVNALIALAPMSTKPVGAMARHRSTARPRKQAPQEQPERDKRPARSFAFSSQQEPILRSKTNWVKNRPTTQKTTLLDRCLIKHD